MEKHSEKGKIEKKMNKATQMMAAHHTVVKISFQSISGRYLDDFTVMLNKHVDTSADAQDRLKLKSGM